MTTPVQSAARRGPSAPAAGSRRVRFARARLLGAGLVSGQQRVLDRMLAGAEGGWVRWVRFAEPLTGRLRPWVSLVTPLGRWTLLAAAVSGLAGVALGWAELGGASAVLLIALVAAIPFVLGRPSYEVRVGLAAVRVVVGEKASGELTVRNSGERLAVPSVVELPVGRALATFAVPRLSPGGTHSELFVIPTQRRAVLAMGPASSVRQDPLALLRREVAWTQPEKLYVHPRTVRLDDTSTGFLRDLEGLSTRDLSTDDVSFHALREYVPGDDLRQVHWRSTARTGQLMIRQFEETRRSEFVIVVSTRLADYADAEEFELGISIAASLSRSALADGKEVTVFTSDVALPSVTPERLLDGYSGITASPAREPLADRVRVVAAECPGASVVAIVSGSATPLEQLLLGAIRVPSLARCFGVRAAAASELGRRRARDFTLVTVPRLEDLPLAVRGVSA